MSQQEPLEAKQHKLFVGALPQATNEDGLKGYFSKYGEVIEAVVMRDNQNQGRSRGFGFVVFAEADQLERALSVRVLLVLASNSNIRHHVSH